MCHDGSNRILCDSMHTGQMHSQEHVCCANVPVSDDWLLTDMQSSGGSYSAIMLVKCGLAPR